MAKLTLMFENKLVKEVPIGSRPVGIGRSPDNDLPVDNLAVSNYHARVYAEAGRLVVHDGDSIWIGKHHIKVDASGDTTAFGDPGKKGAAAPRINETMMLDTKARRDMLQQAAAIGERTQFAASRLKVPTLVVLSGNTDQKEYMLTNKLTVIGKSKMATVKLKGWFKPQLAAQVNQRDDGYYVGPGDKVPRVNGAPITGPLRLNDGDTIEVCGLRMNFIFRD